MNVVSVAPAITLTCGISEGAGWEKYVTATSATPITVTDIRRTTPITSETAFSSIGLIFLTSLNQ
jgi:hypothetical protein